MDRLRAGIALYNTGHYLAAHEPLEELWLEAPAGERDDCVQGLIQATAAVYKSRVGNETGAVGLAESAIEYVTACGELDVDSLATWLDRLVGEPDLGKRERPPTLEIDDETVTVDDLRFPAAAIAATALAETRGHDDVEAAIAYARRDFKAGKPSNPLVTLTLDYLRDVSPIAKRRLEEHAQRRRQRDADVDGLFE